MKKFFLKNILLQVIKLNLNKAWSNYLQMDKLASDLNANGNLVAALFKKTKTAKTFLSFLMEHKSLVMISKPTMGENAQLTTFHTNYGSSLLMQKNL